MSKNTKDIAICFSLSLLVTLIFIAFIFSVGIGVSYLYGVKFPTVETFEGELVARGFFGVLALGMIYGAIKIVDFFCFAYKSMREGCEK